MSIDAVSPEVITSIIFGILQLSIGVFALWQQRQARLLHRMYFLLPSDGTAFTPFPEVRFEGRRYTL